MDCRHTGRCELCIGTGLQGGALKGHRALEVVDDRGGLGCERRIVELFTHGIELGVGVTVRSIQLGMVVFELLVVLLQVREATKHLAEPFFERTHDRVQVLGA